MRDGRMLYRDIWDNKPPLLYLIYALGNADQFLIRFFSLFFGLASVISFFMLSKKLLSNFKASAIATVFFAVIFALPSIEGNIANAENFMLFFSITAANFLLSGLRQKDRKQEKLLFFSGMLLGVSFLFKIVAIFDLAAFVVFLFFLSGISVQNPSQEKTHSIHFLRTTLPIYIGFCLPILVAFLYFFSQGTIQFFVDAVFKQNVGYVELKNDLFIANGLLFLKIFILLFCTSLLYLRRSFFSKPALFIIIWLAFSLFNAFFSGRSYTHYQLVVLPSISLFFGLVFLREVKAQAIVVLVCFVSIIAVLYISFHHWGAKRTTGYYRNFFGLISQQKTIHEYRSFFDPQTPRDYEIVEFLKKNTEKGNSTYLWGNSAQIYTLSHTLPPGRYTVAYHVGRSVQAVEETAKAIEKTKPKYIIIMPDEAYVPFDLREYIYILTIEDTHIYERIF